MKILSLLKLAKKKKKQNLNRDICVTSLALDSGSVSKLSRWPFVVQYIWLIQPKPLTH